MTFVSLFVVLAITYVQIGARPCPSSTDSCEEGDHINTEETYGMHTNGDILNAPQWPQGDNNMFLVPKRLNTGDMLNISGTLVSNPSVFTVSLVTDLNGSPDFQNIPCQLEINFESNPTNTNEILIKKMENGSHINIHTMPNKTPEFFTSDNFVVHFEARSVNTWDLHINNTYLDEVTVPVNVSEVRYIMVKGDYAKVDELRFQFP